MRDEGFTLIELLIVISIIALMSSIVLATVQKARTKATDSSRLGFIHNYLPIFEQYYLDHGDYPVIEGDMDCLGHQPSGNCWDNQQENINNQGLLDTAIRPYIPSYPAFSGSVFGPGSGKTYTGILWRCEPAYDLTVGGDPCDQMTFVWVIAGTNANCTPGTHINYSDDKFVISSSDKNFLSICEYSIPDHSVWLP
jgi:general secretion pathway protein G